MALKRLLLISTDSPDGNEIAVWFDGWRDDQHKWSVKIPDHPLDTGRMVNDHTIEDPEIYEVSAYMVETPMDNQTDPAVLDQLGTTQISVPTLGLLFIGDYSVYPAPKAGPARIDSVREGLRLLKGRKIKILNPRRPSLEDYQIISVTDSIGGPKGRVDFQIQCKQVRFGSAESVLLPKVPRAKKAAPEEKKGGLLGDLLDGLTGDSAGGESILYRLIKNPGSAQGLGKGVYDATVGSFGDIFLGIGGVGP